MHIYKHQPICSFMMAELGNSVVPQERHIHKAVKSKLTSNKLEE